MWSTCTDPNKKENTNIGSNMFKLTSSRIGKEKSHIPCLEAMRVFILSAAPETTVVLDVCAERGGI